MTEQRLKTGLGIFLILAHFSILLLVIFFWLLGGFRTEEMTTAIAIIAPFFASYTTAIIRHIIESKNRVRDSGRSVNAVFTFISFFIPTLFVLLVGSAVVLKAFNIALASFEDFKLMLGAAETIFGIYVGQLIFSLFEKSEAAPPRKENRTL